MSERFPKQALDALVDRLILEQGRLDPLELLMACDFLSYADYESWRLGKIPDLERMLHVPSDEAAAVLVRAGLYAGAQRLVAEPLEHRAWGASERVIRIGAHAGLSGACARAFAPAADRMQLDLFQDSRDKLLEDSVRTALTERRIDDAHAALTRLMALDRRHPRLRRYLRLMQTVEDLPGLGVAERLRELESMESESRDLLGHRARDLLAPLWAALAECLAGDPFDPGSPRLHAGYAWARAGRFVEARRALESQPDWQRLPAILIAHADACRRTADPAAARQDWAMLCWRHPLDAERALGAKDLADTRLHRLWNQFGDMDLDLETNDFPAWLLLADPGMAAAVPPDLAPSDAAGSAYGLLHRMARGEDAIALRKALTEVRPGLLKVYLTTLGGKTVR